MAVFRKRSYLFVRKKGGPMFRKEFGEAVWHFTTNTAYTETLYQDIIKCYSSRGRYYHTLKHLEDITRKLAPVKARIEDWPVLVFAIAYHDVVYNILQQNNEEMSATFAQEILNPLLSADELERCLQLIMATKSHQASASGDINYFIDADLSILGAEQERYQLYKEQIRKEYQYYPDMVYKPGRQKVLNHFLGMDRIFKTDCFYNKYEASARNNLAKELFELL